MPLKLQNKAKEESVLKLHNKANSDYELVIYGPIGNAWDGVTVKQVSDALKEVGTTANSLTIRLSSIGGDVFEGIAIYNRIAQVRAKNKICIVEGVAASIASVVMLACDKVIMGEGTRVMIHKPWTFTAGNSEDLEKVIDRLNDVENAILSVYTKRTGLDRIELKNMMAKETWFDADQAIEYGFATEKTKDGTRIAASIDYPWLHNTPNDVYTKNKAIKEDLKGFLARIKA